jgi:hypothetical protein
MSELVQFVVLQRSEKWVVKSRELERAFGDRRKAIHCAVELANESGKNGKPALVLAGSRRHEFAPVWTFGKDPYPLARSVSRRFAKIERPRSTGPRSTGPRSTGPAAVPVDDRRPPSRTRFVAASSR